MNESPITMLHKSILCLAVMVLANIIVTTAVLVLVVKR